jgi:hypothetical protein
LQSLKFVAKILLIIIHITQGLISMSGAFWISTVIASILVGSHLVSVEDFRNRFRISPWLVSLLGSILWFGVALVEVGAR